MITLKYYDELTPASQEQARRNMIASVANAHRRDIARAMMAYAQDINAAINDPLHVRRLVNGSQAHREIRKSGNDYLIPFIRANRVIFTESGDYVYYLDKFKMIKDGEEYTPAPEEQAALRDAYCDVNNRGPEYHNKLYKTMERVIRRMIVS